MLTANNLSHLVLTDICLPTTEGFPFYAAFPCFLSLPSLDLSVASPINNIKIDVWGLGERLPLQPRSVTLVINHRCAAPNSNKHALHSHKHSVEKAYMLQCLKILNVSQNILDIIQFNQPAFTITV